MMVKVKFKDGTFGIKKQRKIMGILSINYYLWQGTIDTFWLELGNPLFRHCHMSEDNADRLLELMTDPGEEVTA